MVQKIIHVHFNFTMLLFLLTFSFLENNLWLVYSFYDYREKQRKLIQEWALPTIGMLNEIFMWKNKISELIHECVRIKCD